MSDYDDDEASGLLGCAEVASPGAAAGAASPEAERGRARPRPRELKGRPKGAPKPAPKQGQSATVHVLRFPKLAGEGLGMRLEDMVLVACAPGQPADRAEAQRFQGFRLTHLNGRRVHSIEDCAPLVPGCTDVTAVFADGRAGPAARPAAPHIHRPLPGCVLLRPTTTPAQALQPIAPIPMP